jgi:hypothetical protein
MMTSEASGESRLNPEIFFTGSTEVSNHVTLFRKKKFREKEVS